MAWMYLLIAAGCEIAWALLLKQAQGFTRTGPAVGAVATMLASFAFLALAVRDLPVGTAYAIWTGIGAVGVAVFGMLLFGESRDVGRLVSLALVVAGIVGLRLFTKA